VIFAVQIVMEKKKNCYSSTVNCHSLAETITYPLTLMVDIFHDASWYRH